MHQQVPVGIIVKVPGNANPSKLASPYRVTIPVTPTVPAGMVPVPVFLRRTYVNVNVVGPGQYSAGNGVVIVNASLLALVLKVDESVCIDKNFCTICPMR